MASPSHSIARVSEIIDTSASSGSEAWSCSSSPPMRENPAAPGISTPFDFRKRATTGGLVIEGWGYFEALFRG